MKRVGCLAVLWLVVIAGCASSSNTPPGAKDLGGSLSICPDHPNQCGGSCCGSKCIDTSIDPKNCGSCGNVCGDGQLCQGGHCGCFPSGAQCGSGQTCCSSAGCKSLDSDINNCGACGHACGAGATCTNGQCTGCGGQNCTGNQVCCNGTCAATCATDMGAAAPDLSMGNQNTGACQCSDHCASDLIGWCVGDQCCYVNGIAGSCNVGPCTINMTP
jgi:hypothetical protein